jgi:hypothetical protein
MVIKASKCENGTKVFFKETIRYLKLTIGNKTWYWNRGTGEYDGISVGGCGN